VRLSLNDLNGGAAVIANPHLRPAIPTSIRTAARGDDGLPKSAGGNAGVTFAVRAGDLLALIERFSATGTGQLGNAITGDYAEAVVSHVE